MYGSMDDAMPFMEDAMASSMVFVNGAEDEPTDETMDNVMESSMNDAMVSTMPWTAQWTTPWHLPWAIPCRVAMEDTVGLVHGQNLRRRHGRRHG